MVENEIALVVLDPINSFISAKIDAHRDAEIRRVLDPLAALAPAATSPRSPSFT